MVGVDVYRLNVLVICTRNEMIQVSGIVSVVSVMSIHVSLEIESTIKVDVELGVIVLEECTAAHRLHID